MRKAIRKLTLLKTISILLISMSTLVVENCFAEELNLVLSQDGFLSESLSNPSSSSFNSTGYMLAASDMEAGSATAYNQSSGGKKIAYDHSDFKEAWFTENKLHKYLGIATVAMVALTATLPKEVGGAHEHAAEAAAFLGATTVTSGFITHWDDFDLSNGIGDPDNLHLILGTLGAVAMLAAVSAAPEDETEGAGSHPGLGIAGGIAMAFAIKTTW